MYDLGNKPLQNPHPEVVTVGRMAVGPAPENMRKLAALFNRLSDQQSAGLRIVVMKQDRAGHTNHFVRLETNDGRRLPISLGAIDDFTVKTAIHTLCKHAGVVAPTGF